MKIQEIINQAVVGQSVELTTVDQYVLGQTVDILQKEIDKEQARREWDKLPWEEQAKKDEQGNKINPCPDRGNWSNKEVVDAIIRLTAFVNKLAIKPSSSNVFE